MSDPVTQAEIEDVLSSIRRLVSEDGRGTPATQPAQKPEKAKTRLVLTPALRVSSDDLKTREQPQPAEKQSAEITADSPIADDVADVISLDMDSAAAQVENTGATVEASNSEAVAETSQPEINLDIAADANAEMAVPETPATETTATETTVSEPRQDLQAQDASDQESAEAPWRDPEATLFHTAAKLGEDVPSASEVATEARETGVRETEARETAAPETAAPEANEGGEEPVASASFVVEHAGEETTEIVADLSEPVPEHPGAGGSAGVSAVVQKIAELEAKVGRSNEQWEPDGASRDPYAGTNIETLEWKDHLDEDPETDSDVQSTATGQAETSSDATVDDLVQEAVTDETIDQIDNLAAEDSFLDEESLRELVAEIVRAELQGALGERITRNVRKLVRREIHRALSAQDLI